MRVLSIALLLVTLTLSGTPATARQGASPTAEPQRRPRIVVELSDLLTHSPLTSCRDNQTRQAAAPQRVRIASWNIRAAQSAPVDALAAEIRAMQADIVALQEVDIGTRRGGFVDQPGELATALGFQYVFAASINWDQGHYGLALVSRWPVVSAKRYRVDSTPEAEPRIVLEVTVCAGGRPLRMFNLHADRRTESRALGLAHLKRIVQGEIGRGILVLGDLNEYPDAPGVRALIDAGFVDLSAVAPTNAVETRRVDYLLADPTLAPRASPARVWPTDKSDHHALLTDLEW